MDQEITKEIVTEDVIDEIKEENVTTEEAKTKKNKKKKEEQVITEVVETAVVETEVVETTTAVDVDVTVLQNKLKLINGDFYKKESMILTDEEINSSLELGLLSRYGAYTNKFLINK